MLRVTSKYWLRFSSLGVALIAIIIAGAASGSCVFDTSTNFCEQFGIRCKSGQQCAANEAVCIDIGGCGDGIKDPSKGEVCDDGNIEDYQMANGVQVLVNGMPVLDDCSHDCTSTQKCGNNIMDFMEECDFGSDNGISGTLGQFCGINCKKISNVCGNGTPEPDYGEQCDPGPMDSMDCNSFTANQVIPGLGCKVSKCGDGYTNRIALEQCDSAGRDTAECNGLKCTMSICGDGYPNRAAGEQCDDGSDTTLCNGNNNGTPNSANCHIARCGDNYVNGALGEICDRGEMDTIECNGNNNGVLNPASCHVPQCGDGYVNGALVNGVPAETCDNLGGNDTNECNGNKSNSGNQPNNPAAQCKLAECGDGYVNLSHIVFKNSTISIREKCDTGSDSASCNGGVDTAIDFKGDHQNDDRSKCQSPSCGDGYINPKFTPSNADPGQTGEECDNGIMLNSDSQANACRTNCRAPHCGDRIKDDHEDCELNAMNPSDRNCPNNQHCDAMCQCVDNP